MKRLSIIVILGLLCHSLVYADIIPPFSHSVDRCVKIVNPAEFPGVKLFAYVTGPMIDGYRVYQIEANTCLDKGYYHNDFLIFAIETTYLESLGEIDEIDFSAYIDSIALGTIKDPCGGYVNDTNPLQEEEISYKLFKAEKGKQSEFCARANPARKRRAPKWPVPGAI